MALTQQQIEQLNAAAQRVAAGKGSQTDKDNIAYATKTFGYKAPVQIPAQPTSAPVTSSGGGLTDQQKKELDIAAGRVAAGTGSANDKQNLAYAGSKYGYTPQQAASSSAAPVSSANPASAAQDIQSKLSMFGISEEQYKNLTPGEQTAVLAIGDVLTKQIEAGKQIPVNLTPEDLSKLWSEAESDPVISQYYGDAIKVAGADFQQSLSQISGAFTQQEADYQRQFKEQQKNLAETEAEAGRAYSGFRGQAKEKLAKDQSSIIQSSRRQLQSDVYNLGSQFEKQFGTAALTAQGTPSVEGTSYSPYGGIAGSVNTQKLSDVENRYQNLQSNELAQRTTGAPSPITGATTPTTSTTASATQTATTTTPPAAPTGVNTYGAGTYVNGQPTTTPQAPATAPAAPTSPASPAAPSIPFKTGLSAAQQQSIVNLSKKPIAQWTATDRQNWSYATNNAPLPQ